MHLPVRTQHLALQRRVSAGDAPGPDADVRCHGADTGVPQADLHAANMRRLRDEVDAIIEFRPHLEREGGVQGVRTRDAPVIRAVPLRPYELLGGRPVEARTAISSLGIGCT